MKNITPTNSHNHLASHHLILEATLMRNHNPVERFFALAPSRKRAIEAMCASCMGCTHDYLEDGFKKEIRNCSSQSCPLYLFRPYQGLKDLLPQ